MLTARPAGVKSNCVTPISLARAVLASAAKAVDPIRADAIMWDTHWEQNLYSHLNELDRLVARSPRLYPLVAEEGLGAAHALLNSPEDLCEGEEPSTRALPESILIQGHHNAQTSLRITVDGRELSGTELIDQAARWVDRGLAVPSVATSVKTVVEHPEWLPLEGLTVVVLGANARLGVYRPLSRWGANVVAVDLPEQAASEKLIHNAMNSAGTTRLPHKADAAHPGLDIVDDAPQLARWIMSLPGRLLLVDNLRSADPADNVILALRSDLIIRHVLSQRPDSIVAYLGSAADSFAVRTEDREASTTARNSKSAWIYGSARQLSRGMALQPNYAEPYGDVTVADGHLPLQGWQGVFAQRIRRWRAVSHQTSGGTGLFTVAPQTTSPSHHSLRGHLKATAMPARIPGFDLGIWPFDPDTASELMAALLVHDLNVEASGAESMVEREYHNAVHAGWWTAPFSPASTIGLLRGANPRH